MDSLLDIQKQCMDDSEAWFPEHAHDLVFLSLCLAGEVGEFCNVLKKVERGSLAHTKEVQLELCLELCDVLIYLANMAAVLNVDLGKLYDYKREENVRRFGQINNNGDDS